MEWLLTTPSQEHSKLETLMHQKGQSYHYHRTRMWLYLQLMQQADKEIQN